MPAPDPTTKSGVIALMETSQSEDEWNRNCDAVKAANGGNYPEFWYAAIVMSGVMRRVTANFGRDDQIHFKTYQ